MLFRSMTPDLTNRAHRLTARFVVPAGGADGVIVAEGGRYGGFSLFVKNGKLIYENNTFGTTHAQIVANVPLAVGEATAVLEFTPDANSPDRGALLSMKHAGSGRAKLLLNGAQVGEAHFDKFGDFASSIDEPLDIGRDSGSPVSRDYEAPNPYGGRVIRVTIDLL